jgi:geranylgeranyl diphosphate synthase type II
VDDLLDIEGSASKLGKSIGKDAAVGKATFPAIYGVEESRQMAKDLTEKAITGISQLGDKSLRFRILAEYLLNRKS